jgi:mRNA-degrading endonuclease RelE of RelBE toxin-antitoxin system
MAYRLVWKAEVKEEFKKLDHAIQQKAFSQLKKLQRAPQLGEDLGMKLGLDLTGYKKLSFYRKKYRIVYRIDEGAKQVMIVGIGLREAERVYREVARRIRAEQEER